MGRSKYTQHNQPGNITAIKLNQRKRWHNGSISHPGKIELAIIHIVQCHYILWSFPWWAIFTWCWTSYITGEPESIRKNRGLHLAVLTYCVFEEVPFFWFSPQLRSSSANFHENRMICAQKIKIFKYQIKPLEFSPNIQYFSPVMLTKIISGGQTGADRCRGLLLAVLLWNDG